MALHEGIEGLGEGLPGAPGPVDDVLFVEGLERGQPRHHGELVHGEGRGVHHGPVHRAEDAVEDLGRRQHRPHRDVPTRQRLGDGDDVGLQAPVLVAEELARPSQPGLDLVHDEQRLVAPAQRLDRAPVLLGGEVHALALDGLDHEGGHVAAPELLLQGVDVAECHARGGEQRTEPVPELPPAVERQRHRW